MMRWFQLIGAAVLATGGGCNGEPPGVPQPRLHPESIVTHEIQAGSNEKPRNRNEGQRQLSAEEKLVELAKTGFAMASDSVPLGFDVGRIAPTTAKLPNGLNDELGALFAKSWPSDFFLGAIEFFGPDRINAEHDELYPGLAVIGHGFIGFGGNGTGWLYAYCNSDRRVYLLPDEYFSDDGLRSHDWEELKLFWFSVKWSFW